MYSTARDSGNTDYPVSDYRQATSCGAERTRTARVAKKSLPAHFRPSQWLSTCGTGITNGPRGQDERQAEDKD